MATLQSGFASVLERGLVEANNQLRAHTPQWSRIATPVDQMGKGSFIQAGMDAPGSLDSFTSGSLTATTLGAGPSQTITGAGLGKLVRVRRRDYATNPERLAQGALSAARSMERHFDKLVFTLLNGLKTATYSDGDGTPKFISDGSPDHSTSGGSATWSNRVSAAFSEPTFNTALALLQTAEEYGNGGPADFGFGPLSLVCAPGKRSEALKIAASRVLPYANGSSVAHADNPNADLDIEVVANPWMVDADDLYLIDKQFTPLHLAITSPFDFVYDVEVATQDVLISVVGEAVAFCDVPPYGIVGMIAP